MGTLRRYAVPSLPREPDSGILSRTYLKKPSGRQAEDSPSLPRRRYTRFLAPLGMTRLQEWLADRSARHPCTVHASSFLIVQAGKRE